MDGWHYCESNDRCFDGYSSKPSIVQGVLFHSLWIIWMLELSSNIITFALSLVRFNENPHLFFSDLEHYIRLIRSLWSLIRSLRNLWVSKKKRWEILFRFIVFIGTLKIPKLWLPNKTKCCWNFAKMKQSQHVSSDMIESDWSLMCLSNMHSYYQ